MSRTSHPVEKGTPLAGKRWYRRNITRKPGHGPHRDKRRTATLQEYEPISGHDPGDEDRRFVGPWCERCGDAFDGPERSCPNPAPGEPYKDCGRGGHMFCLENDPALGEEAGR